MSHTEKAVGNIAESRNDNISRIAWPALALAVLVLMAYSTALRAGFIWDDDRYVTENPMLTAPDGLKQIWFSAHKQSQYFPLVYTTFRLERMLWGLNPWGYHCVNVLLHAANVILVWALLRRLAIPGAWFAAAIFAIHPVHVESVAWVTELKNVESLFFYLLAFLAWLKFLQPRQVQPRMWYALTLVGYLLSLFAKTTACTFPVAMALAIWLQGERLTLRRIGQILPFVALGAGMGLVSVWWEGNLGAYQEGNGLSFSFPQRLLIASRALWFYAWKIIWPTHLSFSYPRWEIDASNPLQYLPLIACCATGIALWIWRRKLGRKTIAGIVFFAASLLPLLGFISNYTFVYSFVADHYQYTASIGLLAIIAAPIASLTRKVGFRPEFAWAVQGGLLLVLGLFVQQRCAAYLNSETLWRDTLAKNPVSWMAHYNLGLELQTQGRLPEAIEHYQAAVRLNPNHAKAQNNLGLALASQGRTAEAIEHYKVALKIDPVFVDAHNNLALSLAQGGDYGEAVAHLKEALKIEPQSCGMLMNLGNFLRTEGKSDEAEGCFRKAADLLPTDARPFSYLAGTLAEQGKFEEAAASFRRALQLAPTQVELLMDLGSTLVLQTNYDEALKSYWQAAQLAPQNPAAHYNVGVVLAAQGKSREARNELREALRLKPDFTAAEEQLVKLYLPAN